MKIKPHPVYDTQISFGDEDTATVKLSEGGAAVNVLSVDATDGGESRALISVHVGRDGLHSWDKPTFFQPNEEHDGFVTMRTSSGLNVFLSIEQATAIALAVEEATERESC